MRLHHNHIKICKIRLSLLGHIMKQKQNQPTNLTKWFWCRSDPNSSHHVSNPVTSKASQAAKLAAPPPVNQPVGKLSLESRFPFAPTRPRCNSILHLFGAWLFDAALAGVKLHPSHAAPGDSACLECLCLFFWFCFVMLLFGCRGCRFSVIFRYFWPDPFSADPFPVFRYSLFSPISSFSFWTLSLFVFIFCETARTHWFSVIFAKVQWHPWVVTITVSLPAYLVMSLSVSSQFHSHFVSQLTASLSLVCLPVFCCFS